MKHTSRIAIFSSAAGELSALPNAAPRNRPRSSSRRAGQDRRATDGEPAQEISRCVVPRQSDGGERPALDEAHPAEHQQSDGRKRQQQECEQARHANRVAGVIRELKVNERIRDPVQRPNHEYECEERRERAPGNPPSGWFIGVDSPGLHLIAMPARRCEQPFRHLLQCLVRVIADRGDGFAVFQEQRQVWRGTAFTHHERELPFAGHDRMFQDLSAGRLQYGVRGSRARDELSLTSKFHPLNLSRHFIFREDWTCGATEGTSGIALRRCLTCWPDQWSTPWACL